MNILEMLPRAHILNKLVTGGKECFKLVEFLPFEPVSMSGAGVIG